MAKHKKSFFERLTGTVRINDDEIDEETEDEETEDTEETREKVLPMTTATASLRWMSIKRRATSSSRQWLPEYGRKTLIFQSRAIW